jgi:hypothetical protein
MLNPIRFTKFVALALALTAAPTNSFAIGLRVPLPPSIHLPARLMHFSHSHRAAQQAERRRLLAIEARDHDME